MIWKRIILSAHILVLGGVVALRLIAHPNGQDFSLPYFLVFFFPYLLLILYCVYLFALRIDVSWITLTVGNTLMLIIIMSGEGWESGPGHWAVWWTPCVYAAFLLSAIDIGALFVYFFYLAEKSS